MGTSINFNEKKGFICDMDGVIYHGNRILPGVAEFIQWLHEEDKEYLFLTNNSGYTPRELNQNLARMGLDVPEEHFYTSALATAAFLREQAPGCSVFAIGEAGLLNALYDAGITMNDVNPDYVIVGEGRNYSLDSLTKATNLVLAGAKLIGANSDLSGPIENGIAPACRSLSTGCSAPVRNISFSRTTAAARRSSSSRSSPAWGWMCRRRGFIRVPSQRRRSSATSRRAARPTSSARQAF